MDPEEKIIKEALAMVNVEVDSIYDLVNTSASYQAAVPILIGLLETEKIENERLREGIVRSLAVKEARGLAGPVLIREFFKTPREKMSPRWAIGSSIEVVITENEISDVLRIVRDKQNGYSRQMFVLALGKFKSNATIEDTLIALLQDDDVALHAIKALRKLRSKKAIPEIKKLYNHSNKVVRQLAEESVKFLK
jgi:HEAT repeat protein